MILSPIPINSLPSSPFTWILFPRAKISSFIFSIFILSPKKTFEFAKEIKIIKEKVKIISFLKSLLKEIEGVKKWLK